MKQINSISLERMSNGSHFLFITDTVGLATADAKVKTKVTAELTALQTALKAEDDALALSKANLLSKVQKVNALAVVEGEADYADFISKMNEQVKHYKQEVLPKAKKKDDGKQPGDGGKPGEGKKPGEGGKKPGDVGDGKDKPGGKGQGDATVTPKK